MFPYVGIEFAVYETLKIAIEARRAKALATRKRDAAAKDEDASLPTVALLLIGFFGALLGRIASRADGLYS